MKFFSKSALKEASLETIAFIFGTGIGLGTGLLVNLALDKLTDPRILPEWSDPDMASSLGAALGGTLTYLLINYICLKCCDNSNVDNAIKDYESDQESIYKKCLYPSANWLIRYGFPVFLGSALGILIDFIIDHNQSTKEMRDDHNLLGTLISSFIRSTTSFLINFCICRGIIDAPKYKNLEEGEKIRIEQTEDDETVGGSIKYTTPSETASLLGKEPKNRCC